MAKLTLVHPSASKVPETPATTGASNAFREIIGELQHLPSVLIAAGATCAYLGDERNLREYLIADETARSLRRAGCKTTVLIVDDSLDPLKYRQLRVAVAKDERMLAEWEPWCGKPIAHIPDPFECHASFAAHFESELLARLLQFHCDVRMVSTASLYERGLYAPYVERVLQGSEELLAILGKAFPGYTPQKLFWPLCPSCGRIDSSEIESIKGKQLHAHCDVCKTVFTQKLSEAQGKLNWKIDCAVRWQLLDINAEPFTKAYLDAKCGSYSISRVIAEEFFGGRAAHPLRYGTLGIERQFSYKFLECLPPLVLRGLMLESPHSDLTLTCERGITAASRYVVENGLSYMEFVKQVLPTWLLMPELLTPDQRQMMNRGLLFARTFLGKEVSLRLPEPRRIEEEEPRILFSLNELLHEVIEIREVGGVSWEEFSDQLNGCLEQMGPLKKPVFHRLRLIMGQEEGPRMSRVLFALPLPYLTTVNYMLDLYLLTCEPASGVGLRLAA